MRLLLDQDVYAATVRHLKSLGHDVVCVSEIGLSRAKDEVLLEVSREQERVFVTRDRDFGRIVFLNRQHGAVLYLRMLPSTQSAVHRELDVVLRTYGTTELADALVVVEPGGHRIRRLTSQSSSGP